MPEVAIRLVAKDEASPAIKKVGDESKRAGGKLDGLKKSAGGVGSALALIGVSVGLAQLGRATGEALQMGVAYERAQRAVLAYAGSQREATAAIDGIQEASGGAVSRMTAAQNAARLFSMGLADTAEEAEHLSEIALTLGSTMGKGPEEAFENFTLLLANQSILRLDTYGISGAKVRDRMKELQAETKGLDRETAFLTAVLEISDDKLRKLDEAGYQAASGLDRVKAMADDAKLSVGTFLADGILPIVDGVMSLRDATDEWHTSTAAGTSTYDEYFAAWQNGPGYIRNFTGAMSEAEYWTLRTSEIFDDRAESVAAFGAEYAGAAGQVQLVTASLQDLSAAQLGSELKTELDAAYEAGQISRDEYVQGLQIIGKEYMGLSTEMMDANIALFEAKEDLKSGMSDLPTFFQQVFNIRSEIDPSIEAMEELGDDAVNAGDLIEGVGKKVTALPDKKVVEIEIRTVGGIPQFQHGGAFTVGGQGGPDSQLVAFRASPGERVTVQPNVTNNLTINGGVQMGTRDERAAFRSLANDWMAGRL